MKRILATSLLLAAVAVQPQIAEAGTTFLDIGILNPDIKYTRLQMFPDDDVEGIRIGAVNIENENVSGISIAAIATGTKQDFEGIQVAGLRNRVDGKFSGLELALFWNQHFDKADGWLISVFANTADEFNGASSAVFCNWCEALDGWQSSPGFFVPAFFNRAGGESEETEDDLSYSFQFGFVNVHDGKMRGSQSMTAFLVPSLVNIAADVEGVQAGLVNVADTVYGLQFGLFNVTKRLNGIQIGLSNYVGDEFDTAGFHWLPVFNIASMSF